MTAQELRWWAGGGIVAAAGLTALPFFAVFDITTGCVIRNVLL